MIRRALHVATARIKCVSMAPAGNPMFIIKDKTEEIFRCCRRKKKNYLLINRYSRHLHFFHSQSRDMHEHIFATALAYLRLEFGICVSEVVLH